MLVLKFARDGMDPTVAADPVDAGDPCLVLTTRCSLLSTVNHVFGVWLRLRAMQQGFESLNDISKRLSRQLRHAMDLDPCLLRARVTPGGIFGHWLASKRLQELCSDGLIFLVKILVPRVFAPFRRINL